MALTNFSPAMQRLFTFGSC